jgi:hypothetical protein
MAAVRVPLAPPELPVLPLPVAPAEAPDEPPTFTLLPPPEQPARATLSAPIPASRRILIWPLLRGRAFILLKAHCAHTRSSPVKSRWPRSQPLQALEIRTTAE